MASTKIAEEFRKRIRTERERRKWSQPQLAVLIEGKGIPMHTTAIAKIEAGRREVRIDEASAMADLFGLSVDTLLGRSSDESEADRYALVRLSEHTHSALGELRKMHRIFVADHGALAAAHADQLSDAARSVERAVQRVNSLSVALFFDEATNPDNRAYEFTPPAPYYDDDVNPADDDAKGSAHQNG
ncbi:helix-turn-helix domain-containing protein [Smaragdicoccus niigatensis]|uniref:helix-turn-helix domain-containing protein n=1 Tax=Smaragdicoccus niigatensis TaxID=359359 RepID=UPI000375A935|nr:helix-turn-helix transcriptional regulator [Smaragdicoccus niigatensis]